MLSTRSGDDTSEWTCQFVIFVQFEKKTMLQPGQTLPTGRPKELHRTRSTQVTFISAHQAGEMHANKKNFWLTLFAGAERERKIWGSGARPVPVPL